MGLYYFNFRQKRHLAKCLFFGAQLSQCLSLGTIDSNSNYSGAHLFEAHLPETPLSKDPFIRIPLSPEPICRVRICLGPICF